MSCCGLMIMPDFESVQISSPRTSAPFRLTGWHVGAVALGFFLIVATMNGVMMSHAFRTMPGLDARNGYEVSQRFNASLADARVQAARGWQTELSHVRKGSATRLTATIKDRENMPISGLAVTITARHPATRHLDHTAQAVEIAPGRYQVAPSLGMGSWDVEISILNERGGEPVKLSRNRIALGN